MRHSREHSGMSLTIMVISTGVLLIGIALILVFAFETGIAQFSGRTSLEEDLKPALDRACLKWQNIHQRGNVNNMEGAYAKVRFKGKLVSAWQLCSRYLAGSEGSNKQFADYNRCKKLCGIN